MNLSTKSELTRRDFVSSIAASSLLLASERCSTAVEDTRADQQNKKVAAIVTKYDAGLHADVLVGRVLEGWKQDGGAGPKLTLASLYLDQTSDGDLGQQMARKHKAARKK